MPLNCPCLRPPATSKLEMRPVFSHISKSCLMVTARFVSIRGAQNASRTLTSVKGTGVNFCSANAEGEMGKRHARRVSFAIRIRFRSTAINRVSPSGRRRREERTQSTQSHKEHREERTIKGGTTLPLGAIVDRCIDELPLSFSLS